MSYVFVIITGQLSIMSLTDLLESSIIHTSFSDIANDRPVGKMGGGCAGCACTPLGAKKVRLMGS